MENKLPAVAAVNLPAARIETVIAQRKAIMDAVKGAMTDGVHYGKVPGVNKPGCFKPGAEVLCLLFGLRPEFQEKTLELENGHIESVFVCTLLSPDGQTMGQGVGSCSTLESKYRYRNAALRCPSCGKETIIKGKQEYGGGWICFAKKGGCGAKWPDGAPEIETQERGKVENPDVADVRNTVRKMAKKRAHVDAALTTTGASEFFTQDVEDFPEYAVEAVHVEQAPPAQTNGTPQPPAPPPMPEPSGQPDQWRLQATSKRFHGKTLDEIWKEDRAWFENCVFDPKYAARLTPDDAANMNAFYKTMSKYA